MANIKFSNVHKSFGSNKIITDFNLQGNEDEFLVLVGPSGCGKSTLLRMIAGLEKIDEGDIYINDQLINTLHPSKRQTAMVFQSYALYPHMNVYENMAFGLKMEQKKKSEIQTKVKDAAKMLQIENLLNRKPKELSGGQRQRVAIGRAITRNPKIFLFDEPLSNLDAALRAEMRVEISKLHKKINTNMIYVTHDQVEAMTLADRIVILNEGNTEQFSTPSQIYNDPNNIFVAEFIGNPKMNIIKINKKDILSKNSVNFFNNKIIFEDYNFDDEIFFGIRPEHIVLNDKDEIKLEIKVDLVENLGFEKIIYGSVQNQELRVKTSENSIKDINKISFSNKNIYLFDKSGVRIRKKI